MFRSAIFAVLAIALSSSPVMARQVAIAEQAQGELFPLSNAVELSPGISQSLARQLAAVTASSSLVISAEAAVSASLEPGLVTFATAVSPEVSSVTPRNAPWWATTLAVAGPLADGFSTMYAMRQSGPNARVAEGNGLFHKLFGADVSSGKIMAFKVGQAALMGTVVHYGGQHSQAMAIGASIVQAAINFWVSSQNMRMANTARKLNTGAR